MNLAIIGSGPSAIYLLKHLLDEGKFLKRWLASISVFEKSQLTGMGMPYNPLTTDRFNLANISSEELPELPVPMVDWLESLDQEDLRGLGLEGEEISAEKIYPRLVLGQYLHSQYRVLLSGLQERGIHVREFPGCEITDIQDLPEEGAVRLVTANGGTHSFERVVIATGHYWTSEDRPDRGYYASPWPIRKLLPGEGEHHDFTIGTLGASLSAFDLITSLAHRHGRFAGELGNLCFEPSPEAPNFKIVMHSFHGWLPHLQWDQEEAMRVIYRHVGREVLLGLRDHEGFLRLETYFDAVCRPALADAFRKDGMTEMVGKLADPHFKLADLVETMSDKHDYDNAFEGMRREMTESRRSVLGHKPIHWKEVIDDLMYTLNFHAELMPAEDHLSFRKTVMPFLMNVIAAMPLESGEILLALYDAGKIEIISGKAVVNEETGNDGTTRITIHDEDGSETTSNFRIFVDCGGQKPLELPDYPFPSLVRAGVVSKGRVRFADSSVISSLEDEVREHVFSDRGESFYHVGGVDIDSACRLISADGVSSPRIADVAFSHTSGLRPYSYGLQCCSDTVAIFVQAWLQELRSNGEIEEDSIELSKLYEEI
ncbi:FAD/NAD(P)-binding protein [Haloferula sp. BvORR071]|uniref:FAD/NAD(P)-binding protein n=1 Tax=Haloferula sp. BvORR071 TaxID=1396141 RepID=UPI000A72C232|nr:FAD/NAD(P)-binding protein [Haloferula sp. BvORR071]